MTAGSGIIHQEMPRSYDGNMMGFQLWVNLPKAEKMTAPRYMSITSNDVVSVRIDDVEIKLVSGTIDGKRGPVKELYVDVEYFDVHLSGEFSHETGKQTAFIYVYEGSVEI